ncbi:MAG: hypothetical protein JWO30_852 [Fibrobacteres bacterium]|nr:hypothetical protein [Fibrobacterota bacterium]
MIGSAGEPSKLGRRKCNDILAGRVLNSEELDREFLNKLERENKL